MKKKLSIFLLILLPILSFSQINEFAIVQDKDGFANVRYNPDLKSKIVGTVKNKEVFYVIEEVDKPDWFEIGKPNLKGFIHKSRVILFSSFPKIKVSVESENYIRFHNQYATLEIFSEKFNSKKIQFKKIEVTMLLKK